MLIKSVYTDSEDEIVIPRRTKRAHVPVSKKKNNMKIVKGGWRVKNIWDFHQNLSLQELWDQHARHLSVREVKFATVTYSMKRWGPIYSTRFGIFHGKERKFLLKVTYFKFLAQDEEFQIQGSATLLYSSYHLSINA